METFFIILHLVIAALLVIVVLAQEGKDPGMRGIQGASADSSDSFFSKNTGKTKGALLNKMTATIAILFLITTMVNVILTS